MSSSAMSPPLYRPDPRFKEPFTLDTAFRVLDRIPFSPPFLIFIPALVALYSQRVHNVPLIPSEANWAAFNHVTTTFMADHKIPFYIMVFIAVKGVSRTLSRIVHNNGHYCGAKMDGDREIAGVTGGSSGIGKEIAVLLAEKTKHPVAVLDLAPMSYTHPNVRYYNTNVGNEGEFAAIATQIRADIGKPTIIVNNAGASYMSLPNQSVYAMSKAAALAFHKVLKAELRARHRAINVRTTIVCPTKVATKLGVTLADHPNQFITPTLLPETVARRVMRSLENGLSEHLMMPAFAEILPAMRGVPIWLKRFVEIIGHTDQGVTDDSDDRALKSGYAYHLGQLKSPDSE